jgi:hypothetical protein
MKDIENVIPSDKANFHAVKISENIKRIQSPDLDLNGSLIR